MDIMSTRIETKAYFLYGQSRQQNVVIDGIPEGESERRSQSEEKVLSLAKD